MRVIAFGCSFTFGHGLPDCFNPPKNPGKAPSKYAWPSLVANELNVKCINKSLPGSSNKRIWHNIGKFKFKKTDIVFVMWTAPDRSCTLNRFTDVDISPWIDSSSAYYKHYYSPYDSLIMSNLFVSNASHLLIDQGIQVYNLTFNKNLFKLDNTVNSLPICMSKLKRKFPLALDDAHPGIKCHQEMSKQILDRLRIKNES